MEIIHPNIDANVQILGDGFCKISLIFKKTRAAFSLLISVDLELQPIENSRTSIFQVDIKIDFFSGTMNPSLNSKSTVV